MNLFKKTLGFAKALTAGALGAVTLMHCVAEGFPSLNFLAGSPLAVAMVGALVFAGVFVDVLVQ